MIQERSYFPAFVGALVVCALLGLHELKRVSSKTAEAVPAASTTETHTDMEALPEPLPDRSTEFTAGTSLPGTQKIYECRTAQSRVFSDKPCGPDAREHELGNTLSVIRRDQPTPVFRQHVEAGARSTPVAVTHIADSTAKLELDECGWLFAEKDQIDARMRAGYTSSEGEGLRAAHHRVTDRLYELRCRLTH